MSFLSKLAEVTGLKTSDAEKLRKEKLNFVAHKAKNVDRLEGLKFKVKRLEEQAFKKKDEYENATGSAKRMIAREIERIFKDIDRLRGQENIINRNIEQLSVALAKIDELIVVKQGAVTEDFADGLAIDLEDTFREAEDIDRAVSALETVEYKGIESDGMDDLDARLDELAGEGNKVNTQNSELENRLRELEADNN